MYLVLKNSMEKGKDNTNTPYLVMKGMKFLKTMKNIT
jgi:hypothetical protein